MAIIDWPSILHPIDDVIPYLEGHGASAGTSISGQTRYVRSLAARWRYSFRIKAWSNEEQMAWRSFAASVEGPLNLVRMPICDCAFNLLQSSGLTSNPAASALVFGSVPYSDDAPHSDDTEFAQSGIDGYVNTSADAGATSITLDLPSGIIPQAGQGFSIGDRYYQIKSITLVSGVTYLITFTPRLREAITQGQSVSFTEFKCLMRLSDESLLRVERQLLRYSEIELDFVEALI